MSPPGGLAFCSASWPRRRRSRRTRATAALCSRCTVNALLSLAPGSAIAPSHAHAPPRPALACAGLACRHSRRAALLTGRFRGLTAAVVLAPRRAVATEASCGKAGGLALRRHGSFAAADSCARASRATPCPRRRGAAAREAWLSMHRVARWLRLCCRRAVAHAPPRRALAPRRRCAARLQSAATASVSHVSTSCSRSAPTSPQHSGSPANWAAPRLAAPAPLSHARCRRIGVLIPPHRSCRCSTADRPHALSASRLRRRRYSYRTRAAHRGLPCLWAVSRPLAHTRRAATQCPCRAVMALRSPLCHAARACVEGRPGRRGVQPPERGHASVVQASFLREDHGIKS